MLWVCLVLNTLVPKYMYWVAYEKSEELPKNKCTEFALFLSHYCLDKYTELRVWYQKNCLDKSEHFVPHQLLAFTWQSNEQHGPFMKKSIEWLGTGWSWPGSRRTPWWTVRGHGLHVAIPERGVLRIEHGRERAERERHLLHRDLQRPRPVGTCSIGICICLVLITLE